jgi:hypothetical protein
VTNVKERLAEARAAKLKAKALVKKSPEQIAKEQKAEAREQARRQKDDAKQAAIEAGEVEAAKEIARLLVKKFGAGGALELFTIMRRVEFDRVKRLFLGPPNVVGNRSFLTEEEIQERFGGEE